MNRIFKKSGLYSQFNISAQTIAFYKHLYFRKTGLRAYSLNISQVILFFLSFVLLSSCSKNRPEKCFNLNADMERTSDYSYLGKFGVMVNTNEKLDCSDTSGIIQTPLILSKNFAFLANSNGKILIFDNNLFLKSISLDSGVLVASGMCADEEKNLYAMGTDGVVYSFTKSGVLRWKKSFGTGGKFEIFSNLVCNGDYIIAASSSGKITCYAPDGTEKFSINSSLSPLLNFPSSPDKIFIPLTDNLVSDNDSLIAYNLSGKKLWSIGFPDFRILNCICTHNGKLVISGEQSDNNITKNISFLLDTSGRVLNTIEFPAAVRFASADRAGNIYYLAYNLGVGEPQTGIFKYDSAGNHKWHLYFSGATINPPMLDSRFLAISAITPQGTGVFFFSQEDGNLIKTVSLSNAPKVYPKPAVSADGEIVYGGSERLRYVRITSSGMDKVLPF